jgi:hypothetical protein
MGRGGPRRYSHHKALSFYVFRFSDFVKGNTIHEQRATNNILTCKGCEVNLEAGRRYCVVESVRMISTAQLRGSHRFDLQPINVVVYNDPSRKSHLEASFALRCFQRLSQPHVATRQCSWRNNRQTSGASNPVLSY